MTVELLKSKMTAVSLNINWNERQKWTNATSFLGEAKGNPHRLYNSVIYYY